MRNTEPALTSGELVWVNNTEPDSVLSFLWKKDADEILVILNRSIRKVDVALDLPAIDFKVDNLLKEGQTSFELYSGRVSAKLGALEEVVGKRVAHPRWIRSSADAYGLKRRVWIGTLRSMAEASSRRFGT